jgi:hypothetical protein
MRETPAQKQTPHLPPFAPSRASQLQSRTFLTAKKRGFSSKKGLLIKK